MSAITREWDAASYHRVSTPHQAWGADVLGRLALRGDETVLDLGCGTGRITARLLERLPRGRVIAVDGSPAMAERARATLGERATVLVSDLLALRLDEPADAAVSTATFHWIADHDALFARVRASLRPGAPFVAQCGGAGNVEHVTTLLRAIGDTAPFDEFLGGWSGPWRFATPEETAPRLERAGFDVARCWLEPSPVAMDDPREFLATVVCGAHLDRLPPSLRGPLLDALLERLGPPPVTLRYVRLNWVATAR